MAPCSSTANACCPCMGAATTASTRCRRRASTTGAHGASSAAARSSPHPGPVITRPTTMRASRASWSTAEPVATLSGTRRIVTMPLQTVRPNIVQAIRAYRVDELMQAAQDAGQHFLYANLSQAQSKQEVLETIAQSFLLPAHFGKNLDALYDCMTDLVHKAGPQPGFIVVLEQLPDNPRFDREAREQLLDVFRDAADFWAERKIPFRCFYSFQ